MIELTTGYINATSPKFLINPQHIIYIQSCKHENASYKDVNSYVKYYGGAENQVVYVQETYEEIKRLIECSR